MGVVDELEAVDVRHHHREGAPAALRAGQRVQDFLVERTPVGQRRQVVGARLQPRLGLGAGLAHQHEAQVGDDEIDEAEHIDRHLPGVVVVEAQPRLADQQQRDRAQRQHETHAGIEGGDDALHARGLGARVAPQGDRVEPLVAGVGEAVEDRCPGHVLAGDSTGDRHGHDHRGQAAHVPGASRETADRDEEQRDADGTRQVRDQARGDRERAARRNGQHEIGERLAGDAPAPAAHAIAVVGVAARHPQHRGRGGEQAGLD